MTMRSLRGTALFFALVVLAGCGQQKRQQAEVAVAPTPAGEPATAPVRPEATESPDLRQYIVTRPVSPDSIQLVDSSCIVALPPTIAEAAEAQDEGTGEDFEAAADDYTFYFSDVIERAGMAHIPIIDASRRFLRFRISDASTVLIDTRAAGGGNWNPLLFRKGSLPVVYQLVGDPDTNRIRTFFGR
jgi:hypothetical protein